MFSVDIITIFPELFEPFLAKGLIGQAVGRELLVQLVNPRQFTTDVHKSVDDRPYGGGDGMVMMAEPLEKAVRNCQSSEKKPVIYLSPQGQRLTDAGASKLAEGDGFTLICGRYGGVDERFIADCVDLELSIGDYVLNGGEVAAMALIEATSRYLPGVLGNAESAYSDSFRQNLLEAPQMTRPPVYQGMEVPAVLLSGHHKQIEDWRRNLSILRTHFRRPDLLEVSDQELQKALKLYSQMNESERKACGLPKS